METPSSRSEEHFRDSEGLWRLYRPNDCSRTYYKKEHLEPAHGMEAPQAGAWKSKIAWNPTWNSQNQIQDLQIIYPQITKVSTFNSQY